MHQKQLLSDNLNPRKIYALKASLYASTLIILSILMSDCGLEYVNHC